MKKIIVNADDFGINEAVTLEIERMAELGAISSTTVMANGACLDEVRRFAFRHPELSYGVHLCLSEFSSITKNRGLLDAGLTDDDGIFLHKAVFSSKILYNGIVRKAIKEELNAQIDVVTSLGFDVSHADSHHHVHTIYSLREIFAEVLKERGINKVRIGGDFRNLRMRAHLYQWMKRVQLNKYYKSLFKTADSFYSYSDYLFAGSRVAEGRTFELMCHPGHSGQKYRDEMKMVESMAAIGDCSVKLISYNDL